MGGLPNDQALGADPKLYLYRELYTELRSYRDKEFRTFFFAFPIIGGGFFVSPHGPFIAVLLTIFAAVVSAWLLINHGRIMRLKKAIGRMQKELLLEAYVADLTKGAWSEKRWFRHAGTCIYLLLLLLEVVSLLCIKFGVTVTFHPEP